MGPLFQFITLSDHLLFHSLFQKQTLYNFVAQLTVATNLNVSSSKRTETQRSLMVSPLTKILGKRPYLKNDHLIKH